MKLQFAGFEWDDGNRGHCQKHGLSQTEIEGFFQQDNLLVAPDLLHAEREERYLAIGRARTGKTDAGGLHNQDSGQDRAAPSDQRPIYA